MAKQVEKSGELEVTKDKKAFQESHQSHGKQVSQEDK